MSRSQNPCRSTIVLKVVMALTGVVLFGFVIGHLLGNLQVYLGAAKLDAYAKFLKATPALLWGTRLVLLASVAVHFIAAFILVQRNHAARPIGYAYQDHREATYASRTMKWSGPIILLFVIYHLLHFTIGTAHPKFDVEKVYANVVIGFSDWRVSAFYIVAMLALGLHLFHGLWSMFQSLGLNAPKYDACIRRFSCAMTSFIVLGNISIPVAVLAGWVKI